VGPPVLPTRLSRVSKKEEACRLTIGVSTDYNSREDELQPAAQSQRSDGGLSFARLAGTGVTPRTLPFIHPRQVFHTQ